MKRRCRTAREVLGLGSWVEGRIGPEIPSARAALHLTLCSLLAERLPLQDQPGFTNRMTSLSETVIAIGATADTLRKIDVAETYRRWLGANVR